MTEPIVFISHNKVKEGMLEGFRQSYRIGKEMIKADKPDTVGFLAYLNEDGTEVSIVHVFPDANAMDLHMQGVSERAKEAYKFIESDRFEIYGRPSEEVLEMMKKVVGSGVTLSINPETLGGFLRLKSE